MVAIRSDLPLDDLATGIQTGTVGEPSVAASSRSRAPVIEAIRADMAAPAIASFTGVAPPRPAEPSTYTVRPATAAPPRANHAVPRTEPTPRT